MNKPTTSHTDSSVNKHQLVPSGTHLLDVLDTSIHKVWAVDEPKAFIHQMVETGQQFSEWISQVGSGAANAIEQDEENTDMAYRVSFDWIDKAKSFMILWRNVLFEYQKAHCLLLENKISNDQLESLKAQSKGQIMAAADEVFILLNTILQSNGVAKEEEKVFDLWEKQIFPWPTYKEQIKKIAEQLEWLESTYVQQISVIDVFKKIKQDTIRLCSDCKKGSDQIKEDANHFLSKLQSEKESDPAKIKLLIEKQQITTELLDNLQLYGAHLDEHFNKLPSNTRIPNSTDGGILNYVEYHFKNRTRQWMESEIIPLLNEMWNRTEQQADSLRISIVNLTNRLDLLSNEVATNPELNLDASSLTQPLEAYMVGLEKLQLASEQNHKEVVKRISSYFNFTNIFTAEEFLPVSLQSTLSQINLNQNKWVNKGQQWFTLTRNRVSQFRKDFRGEDELSVSEKVVRYVQFQLPQTTNQHYTNIFSTKGHIGESFLVGRERELERFGTIVDQWKASYRGAVILKGNRLCGKSVLGEQMAQRFFSNKTIALQPNTKIRVNGKDFATSFDLAEALTHIRNQDVNNESLIWVDDLEQWNSVETPLSKNVRTLSRFIDQNSGRFFFLFSMSSWLNEYLDRLFGINRVFQTTMNLNEMKLPEVRQAILIRHGATHKTLVNKEGEELSQKLFKQYTSRVFKTANNNIGDALNRWATSIEHVEDEQVRFKGLSPFTMPDFINPETGIILTAIILYKRTKDYQLRKQFGPAFKETYQPVLHRLIRLGLVKRDIDGWLEVNETVANDVARLLIKKKYMND